MDHRQGDATGRGCPSASETIIDIPQRCYQVRFANSVTFSSEKTPDRFFFRAALHVMRERGWSGNETLTHK